MILAKNVFSTGVLGKAIQGRTDSIQYKQGIAKGENMLVTPQGSLIKRQGSVVFKELVDAEEYRLIAYNFDLKNRYILLIIPNELHIYSLDQDWEMTIPFPWVKEDLPNIQVSTYGNRIFLVDGRHTMQELIRLGSTSFSLAPFIFKVPPQKEASFKVSVVAVQTIDATHYEITLNNATNTGLLERGVSSQNTSLEGIITGFNATDSKITIRVDRYGLISPLDELVITGTPSTYLQPVSLQAIGKEITVTSVTNLDNSAPVKALDPKLGTYLAIHGGIIEIDPTKTTETLVVGTVVKPLKAITSTSAFSFLDRVFYAEQQPVAIGQYSGRLWLGGTKENPQRLWASQLGSENFDSFAIGTDDSDSMELDLTGKQSSRIRWLSATQQGLVVGCESVEIVVAGDDHLVTPITINQHISTSIGSTKQQVEDNQLDLLFVSEDKLRVWSYTYDYKTYSYYGFDLTTTNPEITESGIKQIASTANPWNAICCLLNNGTMSIATQGIGDHYTYGWTTYKTHGFISAMCLVSGSPVDTIATVVKRFGKSYLELSTHDSAPTLTSTYADHTFRSKQSDVTHISNTSAEVAVSGLLPSKDAPFVCVWGDVFISKDLTIHAGKYTVNTEMLTDEQRNNPAVDIKLGLSYDAITKLLPIYIESSEGEVTYFNAEVGEIRILVWDTSPTIYINERSVMDRYSSDIVGESPPIMTGFLFAEDGTVRPYGTHVIIEQETPQPLNIAGVWVEAQSTI